MARNYINDIAKMLGVSIGEIFDVYAPDRFVGRFCLDVDGIIEVFGDGCCCYTRSEVLESILVGVYEIRKDGVDK